MKKILTMIIVFLFLLIGCESKEEERKSVITGVTEIKFSDMMDISDLERLDGKKVKIIGFMAESSPLDGSMIYLMNMPYQSCVFCLPNTNQLVNTMAVFPVSGKKIEFTYEAVEVIGTLKVEDITDDMGYFYNYRLVDSIVNKVNVNTISEEIQIYNNLVNKGFIEAFNELILEINININYESFGLTKDNVTKVQYDGIASMFEGLEISKYTDLLEILDRLQVLIDDVNSTIELENYDELANFKNIDVEILYDVYDWLMKPEL